MVISLVRVVISRGFTCSKLDARSFRDHPDTYTGHAADLLGDLCRVWISLKRTDDLGALLRRKPFSRSCRGKRDACSFGNFSDRRVAHAANFPSNLFGVRISLERGDDLPAFFF
jgi:hypothetical protein